MPGAGHRRHVVEHLALGLLHRAEVGNDLGGLHDDLSEKERAGADHLGCHPHDADQRVDLGQVSAVRADGLPDVGDRIQADDVHAVVAQKQHVCGHVVEDRGVAVVQIPLIGIEGGHDHLVGLLTPGEVSGCGLREDLGNGLLELVRDVPVVEEEIPVLVLLLAGTGSSCPLVILTRVVHDEVEADAHAAVMALVGEIGEIIHGAQFRLYLPEVCHRIAAVGPAGRALKERHQVHVVDAALLDVVQVALHALERSSKAVRVHQHAHHLIAGIPVRNHFPRPVPLPELLAALAVVLVQHVAEVVKRVHVPAVELAIQPLHLVVAAGEPLLKLRFPVLLLKHFSPPFIGQKVLKPRCNRFQTVRL